MDAEETSRDDRRFGWATKKAPGGPDRFADVDLSSVARKLNFSKTRYMDAETPTARRIR